MSSNPPPKLAIKVIKGKVARGPHSRHVTHEVSTGMRCKSWIQGRVEQNSREEAEPLRQCHRRYTVIHGLLLQFADKLESALLNDRLVILHGCSVECTIPWFPATSVLASCPKRNKSVRSVFGHPSSPHCPPQS